MIDVVIVNWNAGLQLKKCIDSIRKFRVEFLDKVVVVDNSSVDQSMTYIENYPNIVTLRSGVNLGFGKACNLGAVNCEAEFLLFLNPDAVLYSDTLEKALIYMENSNNADVGICGVQLLDDSGHTARSCARFPTSMGFVCHAIGLDRIIPRFGHVMADWPHDTTKDVDHVIGAFFLVRRELFDALGGFDERFFVYLEDLDFSYRARQAGWRSVYLADVQAYHAGGGTSNQVKAKRLFYSLQSRLLYAFKHFNWASAVLVLLTTLFIEPISRSALAVARRSWSSLAETWQGYGMLWRWLPQWIFKGVTR